MIRDGYTDWHRHVAEREGALGTPDAIWHRMVLCRLGDVRGLRVAEIGCGRGDFAIALARMGARVTALDFSAQAIAIARERARLTGSKASFVVSDAQAVALPDATFDLVLSCEVLEHVPEPRRMIAELHRICRPSGRCIVTTPSYLNGMLIAWAWSLLTGSPINTGAGVQPHENFFLFWNVRRMLRKAGFDVAGTDSRVFVFGLLPRVDPARLRVIEFRSEAVNRILRPFGLHYLFDVRRP